MVHGASDVLAWRAVGIVLTSKHSSAGVAAGSPTPVLTALLTVIQRDMKNVALESTNKRIHHMSRLLALMHSLEVLNTQTDMSLVRAFNWCVTCLGQAAALRHPVFNTRAVVTPEQKSLLMHNKL